VAPGWRKRKGGETETTPPARIKTNRTNRERLSLPAVLLTGNKLFADAGTAAFLLLASDTDLFLEASLLTRWGKLGLGLGGRSVLFPSGELGELDLNLLVGVGVGLGGGLGVPVGRREDAKGHRDAGFKVQIGDL
jgi:hypothetical protein